jgi:hypothetical protein
MTLKPKRHGMFQNKSVSGSPAGSFVALLRNYGATGTLGSLVRCSFVIPPLTDAASSARFLASMSPSLIAHYF